MWTKHIKSTVFTRIKTDGTAKLKSQFPNIYFTTSDKMPTNPKFPTVYLKKLQSPEKGRTLDGTTVNATLASFQIDVIDNKSDNNAENVADVIADIMKSMGIEMLGDPFPDSQSTGEYRFTSRWQRLIGAGEYKKL